MPNISVVPVAYPALVRVVMQAIEEGCVTFRSACLYLFIHLVISFFVQ